MWVPNPEPYEWKPWEVDVNGVPFVKGSAVVLDRIDTNGVEERKRFSGQDAVDEAWATGWHDTNRPETADVIWDVPEPVLDPEKPVEKMNKTEKIMYGDTFDPSLELSMDMTHAEMDLLIKAALSQEEEEEEGEKEEPTEEEEEEEEEEGE